jgi:hypothetical protein
VHKLATNTKRGQPSYIGPFLFHLYAHGNLLTDEKEIQWTSYQFMRELQTTDSEPEMGHEGSKEEDVVELSNEERSVTKKRKLMLGNHTTRTRSATKPVGCGTTTFPLEDNPVDAIIRDLECRAPLQKGSPKHQGHKGDPGVTPGTCGAGGEKTQVILVWVRAPGVGNASHPRGLGVMRVTP